MEEKDKLRVLYDGVSSYMDIGNYDDFKNAMRDTSKRQKFFDGVSSYMDIGTNDQFNSFMDGYFGQQQPAPPVDVSDVVEKPSYEEWYKTVPADRNDTANYDLRRAYELLPQEQLEQWRTALPEDLDKNHLPSVAYNGQADEYEFLKGKDHPTVQKELDWYNSDNPEAVAFRKEGWRLDNSGDRYRYVRDGEKKGNGFIDNEPASPYGDLTSDNFVAARQRGSEIAARRKEIQRALDSDTEMEPLTLKQRNEYERQLKALDNEMNGINAFVDEWNKTEEAKAYYDAQKRAVDDVSARVDQMQADRNRERSSKKADEEGKKGFWQRFAEGLAAAENPITEETVAAITDPTNNDLRTARNEVRNAKNQLRLEEMRMNGEQRGLGFLRGMETANYYELMPAIGMADAMSILQLSKDIKDGKELTDSQKLLKEAMEARAGVDFAYQDNNTLLERIGQSAPEQLMFTLQFVIGAGVTGATSAGERVAARSAERAAKRLAKKEATSAARNFVGTRVLPELEGMAVSSAIQTFANPLSVAGMVEDFERRYAGDIYYDKEGNLHVFDNDRSAGQAAYQAIASAWIENFTEYAGGNITKSAKLLDSKMFDLAGKFDNVMKTVGAGKIQDVFRIPQQLGRLTQIGSAPEEFLEEELGSVMNALMMTDAQRGESYGEAFKNTTSSAFAGEQQLETFLSCAITSMLLGGGGNAVNGVRNAGLRKSVNQDVEQSKALLGKVRGIDIEGLDNMIENGRVSDISAYLKEQSDANNWNKDEQGAAVSYVLNRSRQIGVKHNDDTAIEAEQAEYRRQAEDMVNRWDGQNIYNVTYTDRNGETQEGTIVNGRVHYNTNEDGTYTFDPYMSSGMLAIRRADGSVEQVAGRNVTALNNVATIEEQLESQNQTIGQLMREEFEKDGMLPTIESVWGGNLVPNVTQFQNGRYTYLRQDDNGLYAFANNDKRTSKDNPIIYLTERQLIEYGLSLNLENAQANGDTEAAQKAQEDIDFLKRLDEITADAGAKGQWDVVKAYAQRKVLFDANGGIIPNESNEQATAAYLLAISEGSFENAITSVDQTIAALGTPQQTEVTDNAADNAAMNNAAATVDADKARQIDFYTNVRNRLTEMQQGKEEADVEETEQQAANTPVSQMEVGQQFPVEWRGQQAMATVMGKDADGRSVVTVRDMDGEDIEAGIDDWTDEQWESVRQKPQADEQAPQQESQPTPVQPTPTPQGPAPVAPTAAEAQPEPAPAPQPVSQNETPEPAPIPTTSDVAPSMEFPRDEEGNIDYEQITDPYVYAAAVTEEFGEDALNLVDSLIEGEETILAESPKIKDAIKRFREQRNAKTRLERFKKVRDILTAPQEQAETTTEETPVEQPMAETTQETTAEEAPIEETPSETPMEPAGEGTEQPEQAPEQPEQPQQEEKPKKKSEKAKKTDEAALPTQQTEQPAEATPTESAYGANNKLVSTDQYEELKRRMKEKLRGQANAGFDPEILSIGAQMAVYHIEAGARKFADFAKRMIDDLGDAIRPYLKGIYNGARDILEEQAKELVDGMTPYDEVRAFDVSGFGKEGGSTLVEAAQEAALEGEIEKQQREATEKIKEIAQKGKKDKTDNEKAVSLQQENKIENETDKGTAEQEGEAVSGTGYMNEAANDTINKLGLQDRVTILDSTEGLTGKRKKAKGWFDTKTGKIVIVMPNHNSPRDVVKTILHEGVAHYGLRQLVGEKNMNEFLDRVFEAADKEVRGRIIDLAMNKYDRNFRKATEEYLAGLAEDTNFDNPTFLEKVKALLVKLLDKMGIQLGNGLTDNELRYILWKSYRNLVADADSLTEIARDAVMQSELEVGDFAPAVAAESMAMESPENGTEQDDTLFRDAEPANKIAEEVNRKTGATKEAVVGLVRWVKKFWRNYADYARPIQQMQESIEKSLGRKVRDSEDVARQIYRMPNICEAVYKAMNQAFMVPLKNAIGTVIDDYGGGFDKGWSALSQYLIAKHGLERNEWFVKQGKKEGDYAGLTGLAKLLGKDEKDYKAVAEQVVKDFEDAINPNHLETMWKRINAITDALLQMEKDSGLTDKAHFDELKAGGRWQHYVPLRGFYDKTSGEYFDYDTEESMTANPIKRMRGRTSLAADPLAAIAEMMQQVILASEKNSVGVKFFNLAVNSNSDLLRLRNIWMQQDVNGKWIQVAPDIPDDATPEEVADILNQFEADMKQKKANGEKVRKGVNRLDLTVDSSIEKDVKVLPKDKPKHEVLVYVNGKPQIIYVNGNPEIARVMNEGARKMSGDLLGKLFTLTRWKAQLQTTYSPLFPFRNTPRDVQYMLQNAFILDGGKGWRVASRNVARAVRAVPRLVATQYWTKNNKANLGKLLHSIEVTDLDGNVVEKLKDKDAAERILQWWQEFLDNGGETGMIKTLDAEQYEKDLKESVEKLMKGGREDGESVLKKLTFGGLKEISRASEDISRFAAYMAYRSTGHSIHQSATYANNATLNFQKKGGGTGAALLRGLFPFINARIRGIAQQIEIVRDGTWAQRGRLAGVLAWDIARGYIVQQLNALLISLFAPDDDDDDNGRADVWDAFEFFSQYKGNNNTVIYSPLRNKFITVPNPQEYAPFMAIGNIWFREKMGWNTSQNMNSQILDMFIGQSPIEISEGGTASGRLLRTLWPGGTEEIAEVITNENFMGNQIWYDNPYNQNDAMWTKAKDNVPDVLVNLAKRINKGQVKPVNAKWDFLNNPAAWWHLIKGAAGGTGRTIEWAVKTVQKAIEKEDIGREDMPGLRAWFAGTDPDDYQYGILNSYLGLNDFYKIAKDDDNDYKKMPATTPEVIRWEASLDKKVLDIVNIYKTGKDLDGNVIFNKAATIDAVYDQVKALRRNDNKTDEEKEQLKQLEGELQNLEYQCVEACQLVIMANQMQDKPLDVIRPELKSRVPKRVNERVYRNTHKAMGDWDEVKKELGVE